MPSVTNKSYDGLIEFLSNFSKGLVKHASNEGIAASLNTSEIEVLKTELERFRRDYIDQEKRARESYNRFKLKFQYAQKKVSNDTRIIRGILGPKSKDLIDFGILPERSKAGDERVNV